MKLYTLNRPAQGKNEDNFLARKIDDNLALAVVADGLSDNNGAVASQCVISRVGLPLEKRLQTERIVDIKRFMEETIFHVNRNYLTTMDRKDPSKSEKGETTLDIVVADLKDKMLHIESIGDSTVMLIYENGEVEYITPKPIDESNHKQKPSRRLGNGPDMSDSLESSKLINDLTYKQVSLADPNKRIAYVALMSDGITNALLNLELENLIRNHKIGIESPQVLLDNIAKAIYSPKAKIYNLIARNKIKNNNWEEVIKIYRDQLLSQGVEHERLEDIDSFKQVFDDLKDTKIGREMIRTLAIKEKVIDDSTLVLIDILDKYSQYPVILNSRIGELEGIVAQQNLDAEQEKLEFTRLAEETGEAHATTIASMEEAFDGERREYEERITDIETTNATTIAGLEATLQKERAKYDTALEKITKLEDETEKLNGIIDASEIAHTKTRNDYKTRVVSFVSKVYKTIGEKLPTDIADYELEALYALALERVNELNSQNQDGETRLSRFLGLIGIGGDKKRKKELKELLDSLPQFEQELERLRTIEGRYKILKDNIFRIKEVIEGTKDKNLKIYDPRVGNDPEQEEHVYVSNLIQSMGTSYQTLNRMIGSLEEQVETLRGEVKNLEDTLVSPVVVDARVNDAKRVAYNNGEADGKRIGYADGKKDGRNLGIQEGIAVQKVGLGDRFDNLVTREELATAVKAAEEKGRRLEREEIEREAINQKGLGEGVGTDKELEVIVEIDSLADVDQSLLPIIDTTPRRGTGDKLKDDAVPYESSLVNKGAASVTPPPLNRTQQLNGIDLADTRANEERVVGNGDEQASPEIIDSKRSPGTIDDVTTNTQELEKNNIDYERERKRYELGLAHELDDVVNNIIERDNKRVKKLDPVSAIELVISSHLIYLASNKDELLQRTDDNGKKIEEDIRLYKLFFGINTLENRKTGDKKGNRKISEKQVEICMAYIKEVATKSEYRIRQAYIDIKSFMDYNQKQGKKEADYVSCIDDIARLVKEYRILFTGKRTKDQVKDIDLSKIIIEEQEEIIPGDMLGDQQNNKRDSQPYDRGSSTLDDDTGDDFFAGENSTVAPPVPNYEQSQVYDKGNIVKRYIKRSWPYAAAAVLVLSGVGASWYAGLFDGIGEKQDAKRIILKLNQDDRSRKNKTHEKDTTRRDSNVSDASLEDITARSAEIIASAEKFIEKTTEMVQERYDAYVQKAEEAKREELKRAEIKKETPKYETPKLEEKPKEKPEEIATAAKKVTSAAEDLYKKQEEQKVQEEQPTSPIKVAEKPAQPIVTGPNTGLGSKVDDAMATVEETSNKIRTEAEKAAETIPKPAKTIISTRPIIEGVDYSDYTGSPGFDKEVKYTKIYQIPGIIPEKDVRRSKSFVIKSELYKQLIESQSLDDIARFRILHAMEVMKTRGYNIDCNTEACSMKYAGGKTSSIVSASITYSGLELKVEGRDIDHNQLGNQGIPTLDQLNMMMIADYFATLGFKLKIEEEKGKKIYIAERNNSYSGNGLVRITYNQETQNIELFGQIIQNHHPYKLTEEDRTKKQEEIDSEIKKPEEERDNDLIKRLTKEKKATENIVYYSLVFNGEILGVEGGLWGMQTSLYNDLWNCNVLSEMTSDSLTGPNGYHVRCGTKIMIETKNLITHIRWDYSFPDKKMSETCTDYSNALGGNLEKGVQTIMMIKNSYGG